MLTWIGRNARISIFATVVIFAAALSLLAFLPGEMLPLESDLTIRHPRPNPALDAQNLISQRFGMHDWLLVDLGAGSPEELVALAHRVDRRLAGDTARQAGVVGTFGLGNASARSGGRHEARG